MTLMLYTDCTEYSGGITNNEHCAPSPAVLRAKGRLRFGVQPR
jgi:hypothetical protein